VSGRVVGSLRLTDPLQPRPTRERRARISGTPSSRAAFQAATPSVPAACRFRRWSQRRPGREADGVILIYPRVVYPRGRRRGPGCIASERPSPGRAADGTKALLVAF